MMNSVQSRCGGLGTDTLMNTVLSATWSASGCAVPDYMQLFFRAQ